MSASTFKPSIWNRLRNAFFTGLLVLAPATITIYVVWRLFVFVDHLLGATLRGGYIRPGGVPGLGFLTVLAIILAVGFLTFSDLRDIISGNQLKLPDLAEPQDFIRGDPLLRLDRRLATVRVVGGERVVLLEFPTPGRYALAFVTASPASGVTLPGGAPLVGVFLPHAPNPTTGFLLFYPPETLIPTSLRVEQALKMVVSGGVVNPGTVA